MLSSSIAGRRGQLGDRQPAVGDVRFGTLARTAPIDPYFGLWPRDPIDRFYIESFLDKNRSDIAGRVLEVADATYSRRFGAERVNVAGHFAYSSGQSERDDCGDISKSDVLPRESFDCIVFTQTLQFIYELRPAVAQLHAALRPGGVLLATMPGISQIDRAEDWGGTWFWTFSSTSALRLFTEVFEAGSVSVESQGNVFAALSLLHGLAAEELAPSMLLVEDADYPVVVTLRARKRLQSRGGGRT